jgi:hypothetical protein
VNTAPVRYAHPFSADNVQDILGANVLTEDSSVERIDGELVVVAPQRTPHRYVVTEVRILLGNTYENLREQLERHAALWSALLSRSALTHSPNPTYRGGRCR